MKPGFRCSLVAGAISFALVVASCGSDDGQSAEETAPTAVAAVSPDTTGSDTTVSDQVACGEPGFSSLEPQPLAEMTDLTLSAAGKIEAFAPVFLAAAQGEFEKENLNVDIVITQTAVQSMVTGEVDASFSAPSLEMINAIRQDINLRWISGNYSPIEDTEIGVYTRTDLVGEDPDFSKLKGQDISLSNPAGLTLATLSDRLEESGLTLSDVNVIKLAPADSLIALENGALGAAWLNAPFQREVADKPEYVFMGGQYPGTVGGGLIAGPNLLDENKCELITAALRAIERTAQTSLAPGYKDDPAIVTELAAVLEIPEESITSTEELVFTQRIPADTMDKFQDALIEFGLITEDERVPADQLMDQSYLDGIDGAR